MSKKAFQHNKTAGKGMEGALPPASQSSRQEPRENPKTQSPYPLPQFRPYHAALIVALGVLLGAQYWLGREMFERYRFNMLRRPQLAQESQWARMTAWMPLQLRQTVSRAVLGSLPTSVPGVVSEYMDRLHDLADIFPYDGILQLDLARQLFEQARRRRGPTRFEQIFDLFQQALEHNRRAFDTYFDVEAYGQMAWIHMEMHALQLAAKRKDEAEASLQTAIEGFNRVLVLNPGDVDALEHLAYIYSYIASASKRREDWLASLDHAKRLLEAQHDNTNAFYFIGIAYENLELLEPAMTYYFKTLTYPSTMPAERRMWDSKVIRDHLVQIGYTREVPPTP